MNNQLAREELLTRVLSARTLTEIDAAEQALTKYLDTHPEDAGLLDGYEQLAMLRDAISGPPSPLAAGIRTEAVPETERRATN